MTITTRSLITLFLTSLMLIGCTEKPAAPKLTLTSYEGSTIELNENTPLTAIFFFSMSNPVALGEFDRLPDKLYEGADQVAVAMDVDRPPNVGGMQQRTLIPIVIDKGNRISAAFGGIELTPAIYLVKKGKILFQQSGRLDYDAINATIVTKQ